MDVRWGDRFDALADDMFCAWEKETRAGDPLARRCVVTDGQLRAEWLRRHWLLNRRGPSCRVLANVDFVQLYPFVNDVLEAALGKDPSQRRPTAHPWSRELLTWRIDYVLRKETARFPSLADYVGTNPKTQDGRRFALAAKLAESFDEYSTVRPRLLKDWEALTDAELERLPEEEKWQAGLWRCLRAETEAASYADELVALEQGNLDLSAAVDRCAVKYRSIDVFGVAWMPPAYVTFFHRIGQIPGKTVRLHLFNPCRADWYDTADWVSFRTHPMLGMFATGAQGVLRTLARDCGATVASWTEDGRAAPKTRLGLLQESVRTKSVPQSAESVEDDTLQIHAVHSPRRELETLRDGIRSWLTTHAAASQHPSQVLVLCADYDTYVPFIESVFAGSSLPKVRAGRGVKDAGATPEAFLKLLTAANARFEAAWVTDLLGVDDIACKFGLDSLSLARLPQLLESANIHWGLDAAHVARTLGIDVADVSDCCFTWDRGLARLALGMLGAKGAEGEFGVIDGGRFDRILPCADAAEGSAAAVVALYGFIGRLRAFAEASSQAHSAAEWQELLHGLVQDCFHVNETNRAVLSALNRTIVELGESLAALETLHPEAPPRYGIDVIRSALKSRVSNLAFLSREQSDDAIVFAPLKLGNAYPADLVCVCGLNSEAFPRCDTRPAYDLIGKRPEMSDQSTRRADLLALLEAVMSARETLRLSYVGRSDSNNAECPPSVALAALADYANSLFQTPVAPAMHKLQPFSAEYFRPAADKQDPRLVSWSRSNLALAKAFAAPSSAQEGPQEFGTDGGLPLVDVSSLEQGVLNLDQLATVLDNPCKALAARLGVGRPYLRPEGNRHEPFSDSELDYDLQMQLAFLDELTPTMAADAGTFLHERGWTRTRKMAEFLARASWESDGLFREYLINGEPFGRLRTPLKLKDSIQALAGMSATDCRLDVCACGRNVTLRAELKILPVTLPADGAQPAEEVGLLLLPQSESLLPWLLHLLANAVCGRRVWSVDYSLNYNLMDSLVPVDSNLAKGLLTEFAELATRPYLPMVPYFPMLVDGKGALLKNWATKWDDSCQYFPKAFFWQSAERQTDEMKEELARVSTLARRGRLECKLVIPPPGGEPASDESQEEEEVTE